MLPIIQAVNLDLLENPRDSEDTTKDRIEESSYRYAKLKQRFRNWYRWHIYRIRYIIICVNDNTKQ